jgi:hypothetical protein
LKLYHPAEPLLKREWTSRSFIINRITFRKNKLNLSNKYKNLSSKNLRVVMQNTIIPFFYVGKLIYLVQVTLGIKKCKAIAYEFDESSLGSN